MSGEIWFRGDTVDLRGDAIDKLIDAAEDVANRLRSQRDALAMLLREAQPMVSGELAERIGETLRGIG